MIKQMNHAEYQKSLKRKTVEQLQYIVKDAREAADAMPNGCNAGYYADEFHYALMELAARAKKVAA